MNKILPWLAFGILFGCAEKEPFSQHDTAETIDTGTNPADSTDSGETEENSDSGDTASEPIDPSTSDDDGDGFSENDGDCDDNIPYIHPNAEEIWYDGIDQNCDGFSDFDRDQDGFDAVVFGGDDCDDHNLDIYPGSSNDADGDGFEADCECDDGDADIHPNAEDVFGDLIDQDCSGTPAIDCSNYETLPAYQFAAEDFACDPNTPLLLWGDLIIESEEESLSELYCLCEINGDLQIKFNNELSDLSGLGNVESIGGALVIQSNRALQNFQGLEMLRSIEGSMRISDNEELQSFNGLKKLETVFKLTVRNNDQLINFMGLDSLHTIQDSFAVDNNSALQSLHGLAELQHPGTLVNIFGNPKLGTLKAWGMESTELNYLSISLNESLYSLQGFESLTETTV